MVRCLTLLHKVDYKALGLGDYGKPSQFYERQISRLHSVSQAQQSGEVPPLPKLSELLAWFSSNLPSAAISLIHGDYKLDNVVFHQQECRIIGMLDWELSTLGHPLSDLANMMILHYFPSTVSAPFKGLDGPNPVDSSSLQDSGIPSRMELLKYYCELTNRAFPPPEWTFCVAFALFKVFYFF
jgi:aminoglycoside phosphotransferase (APT) family kinase protein